MIKADANRKRSVPGSQGLPPEAANHAIREYLATLDEAAFGAATPVTPKFLSIADPASRWTGANGGLAFFAYCTKSSRAVHRRLEAAIDGRLETATSLVEIVSLVADSSRNRVATAQMLEPVLTL